MNRVGEVSYYLSIWDCGTNRIYLNYVVLVGVMSPLRRKKVKKYIETDSAMIWGQTTIIQRNKGI